MDFIFVEIKVKRVVEHLNRNRFTGQGRALTSGYRDSSYSSKTFRRISRKVRLRISSVVFL